MTQKQLRKLAKEIYACERIRQDEVSTKDEKFQAENRIMQITNQINGLHDGIEIMLEIDQMVQELANKNNF